MCRVTARTGPTRLMKGTPFKWNNALKALTNEEFASITTGIPTAGIFVNSKNEIGFHGRNVTDGLVINIKGADYVLLFEALNKLPIASDAFNRSGNINNSAVDNSTVV